MLKLFKIGLESFLLEYFLYAFWTETASCCCGPIPGTDDEAEVWNDTERLEKSLKSFVIQKITLEKCKGL